MIMAYRQKEYNYNDKLTKDQNLLMDKLYKMRMSGMAEAFENQLMNPNSGLESFETRFSEIINHEWSGRENKKFNRLLKQATLKYPAADLDSSLYDPERQLNTHVIELLAKGDWIDEPNNLLITGGAGAGKTHVACALCVTNKMAGYDLLVIDDFGLMDLNLDKCRDLFEIIEARDCRKSTVIISQMPVANWYQLFGDNTYADACLSRMTSKAYRLDFPGRDRRVESK